MTCLSPVRRTCCTLYNICHRVRKNYFCHHFTES